MKKKILGVLSAVVFLSCAVALLLIVNNKNSNTKLTEAQIASLRTEYPICYGTPPTVDMVTPTLDQVIDTADTFVFGKVIGEVSHYYVDISTGHEVLDKKRTENGLSNTYEFYEYTIEVISDTQDIIDKPQITITRNSQFKDYDPLLKDGMKFITPVSRTGISDDEPLRYNFRKDGFYYVTEDGYALSAFEEDAKTKKSGIQVEALMKQLKEKKDEMLRSAEDSESES